MPEFARDVSFAFFRHRDSVKYVFVRCHGAGVRCQVSGVSGQGSVVSGQGAVVSGQCWEFSKGDVATGRFAVWCAKKAMLENWYFIIPENLPLEILQPLKVAFDHVSGPEKPPLFDHVVTGSLSRARELLANYDAFDPCERSFFTLNEDDADSEMPIELLPRVGKGRNAVVIRSQGAGVSGQGSGDSDQGAGLRLDFGIWSHNMKWVMDKAAEWNAARSRFLYANPGVEAKYLEAFSEAYHPIASHTIVPDVEEVYSVVDGLVGLYDPLILVGDDLDSEIVSELYAVFGPTRMFRTTLRDPRKRAA